MRDLTNTLLTYIKKVKDSYSTIFTKWTVIVHIKKNDIATGLLVVLKIFFCLSEIIYETNIRDKTLLTMICEQWFFS